MDKYKDIEVWGRLIQGKPLDGLGFATIDGRIDLRGLAAPDPSEVEKYRTATMIVKEQSGLIAIGGVHWKGIDFSNCRLNSLRFFDSIIENCSFDAGHCRDWRMWNTRIINTTFRGADLRDSALGAVENGKRNSFKRVDFTKADLRQTSHGSADMVECIFVDTKLAKVDFHGTVFENCIFSGELNEVLFYRYNFRGEAYPPNEMKGVDFRHATLRYVEFRELDMNDVKWPEDSEHIILKNYKASLDKMLNALKLRSDVSSRRLTAILGMMRKWAGPNQAQGILSKAELVGAGGEELVAELLRLCT